MAATHNATIARNGETKPETPIPIPAANNVNAATFLRSPVRSERNNFV